jgi:hypothetical protein
MRKMKESNVEIILNNNIKLKEYILIKTCRTNKNYKWKKTRILSRYSVVYRINYFGVTHLINWIIDLFNHDRFE